jgi:hypothetical protein
MKKMPLMSPSRARLYVNFSCRPACLATASKFSLADRLIWPRKRSDFPAVCSDAWLKVAVFAVHRLENLSVLRPVNRISVLLGQKFVM